MTAATQSGSPRKSRAAFKLLMGLLLVIAAGLALAWVSMSSLRQRTVQVETLQQGSGPKIQAPDGVLLEYEGRLDNGTVFDSSGGRPVPLLASQVIPGFSQALFKMQKGGRYRIRIPSQLAYGSSPPAGAPIPPNADLTFDVKIVQIVPNAAAMQGAPPQ